VLRNEISDLLTSVNSKDREAANWRESYNRLYTSNYTKWFGQSRKENFLEERICANVCFLFCVAWFFREFSIHKKTLQQFGFKKEFSDFYPLFIHVLFNFDKIKNVSNRLAWISR